eukprot:4868751-Prymnesium_polylepis.1
MSTRAGSSSTLPSFAASTKMSYANRSATRMSSGDQLSSRYELPDSQRSGRETKRSMIAFAR